MSFFKGKTAIVTGGGSGIGRAVCILLREKGVPVVAADINMGDATEGWYPSWALPLLFGAVACQQVAYAKINIYPHDTLSKARNLSADESC